MKTKSSVRVCDIDTPEDMVRRVFAVAALLLRAKHKRKIIKLRIQRAKKHKNRKLLYRVVQKSMEVPRNATL